MTQCCEACAKSITGYNTRRIASLHLCVDCYEVIKANVGKPRSELKQIIKEDEKAICKDLKVKGVRRPKKWLEDEKKRIRKSQ